MAFADFAGDWDWTENAAEDEQTDDSKKGMAFSQLSGTVFLVDCGPGMLYKHNAEEESNYERCIKCIRNVCQQKVISSEKDMLAVVFYGLLSGDCVTHWFAQEVQLVPICFCPDDRSNNEDGKAIYVLQDLDQLNIKRITDLDEILEDSQSYLDRFEKSDNFDMSDVLWACSNIFAKCNKTFGEKKILLFTDNDDPHSGDSKLARKAVAKATDLKGTDIEVDLLPMIHDYCGEKENDGKFDVKKFYSEILALYGDADSKCMEPSDKFEDLLSRVYRKEHKRRALGRIPFKIGASTELSVGIYCLARKATIPTSVKIHQASNSEIRTQTKIINTATGDDVMPQDIKKYQEYAGRRILMEPDEVNLLKSFDISGLKLQGFKKKTEVKLHLHVKPSHFIYPDETSIKGSRSLFTALLSRCAARDMVAVCHYVPRSNSTLEIVYLLPQLEERDSQGHQITPPGFHVLFTPFKEDVREVPALEEEIPCADRDTIDNCKAVIKKLSFPYEPSQFENPCIQKFYSNLEALALGRDEPEEITDYTIPNLAKMDKKARDELDAFTGSVWPDGYTPPVTAAKRPAASASGVSKKAKIDPDNIDAKSLAQADKLSSLTVANLKTVIRAEKIQTTATKKADLIDAIKHHFGV